MRRNRWVWGIVLSLVLVGVASAGFEQFEAQLCWQLFTPSGNTPLIDVIRCAVENSEASPDLFQAHCDDKGFFYHAGGAGSIQQYDAVDSLPTVEFELTLMFTRRVDEFFTGNANCGFTARVSPPEFNGPGAFQCSGGPGLPSNVDVFIKLKACPGATLKPPTDPPETEPPAGDTAMRVNAFGMMTLAPPVEPAGTAAGQVPSE